MSIGISARKTTKTSATIVTSLLMLSGCKALFSKSLDLTGQRCGVGRQECHCPGPFQTNQYSRAQPCPLFPQGSLTPEDLSNVNNTLKIIKSYIALPSNTAIMGPESPLFSPQRMYIATAQGWIQSIDYHGKPLWKRRIDIQGAGSWGPMVLMTKLYVKASAPLTSKRNDSYKNPYHDPIKTPFSAAWHRWKTWLGLSKLSKNQQTDHVNLKIIAAGDVYAPTDNGDKHTQNTLQDVLYGADTTGSIYAINGNNGNILWRSKAVGIVVAQMAAHLIETAQGPRIVLVCLTVTNDVVVIDGKNGHVLWRRHGNGDAVEIAPNPGPVFTPWGLAISCFVGELSLFHPLTGRLIWSHSVTDKCQGPFMAQVPQVMAILAPGAVPEAAPLKLEARALLEKSPGDLTSAAMPSWSVMPGEKEEVTSNTVLGNPLVKTCANTPKNASLITLSYNGQISGMDATNGSLCWYCNIASEAKPACGNGVLCVLSKSNALYGIDTATGRIRWVMNLPARRWYGPIFMGSQFYIMNSKGVILSVCPPTGATEVVKALGVPCAKGLMVHNEKLWVYDALGTLWALAPAPALASLHNPVRTNLALKY